MLKQASEINTVKASGSKTHSSDPKHVKSKSRSANHDDMTIGIRGNYLMTFSVYA